VTSERLYDTDAYTGHLVVRLQSNRPSTQPCAFTLADLSRTAVEQLDESKDENVYIVAISISFNRNCNESNERSPTSVESERSPFVASRRCRSTQIDHCKRT
jgi:hypothetical protein